MSLYTTKCTQNASLGSWRLSQCSSFKVSLLCHLAPWGCEVTPLISHETYHWFLTDFSDKEITQLLYFVNSSSLLPSKTEVVNLHLPGHQGMFSFCLSLCPPWQEQQIKFKHPAQKCQTLLSQTLLNPDYWTRLPWRSINKSQSSVQVIAQGQGTLLSAQGLPAVTETFFSNTISGHLTHGRPPGLWSINLPHYEKNN